MKAVLIDVTKCTGCETCVQGCREAHALPPELPARGLRRDGLSSRRLSSIIRLREGSFAKKQCLHCAEPACVDACPVGAIQKRSDGPVIYDRDKCMGCRYCMLACPTSIPRYEWEAKLPYMKKCDLCEDRVAAGEFPVCVEKCPQGALEFGDRDTLLRQAHALVDSDRERYLNHVYGESELGGTWVLYVSGEPLDQLGWPAQVGDRTVASFTWPVISKTPWVAASVAGLLVGTHLVIGRRMKLEREQGEKK